MSNPNAVADTMSIVFKRPSTENESRIRIVEIIKPEFLMTL